MKKKLLSLLLSLAMMPALLPVSAMAADLTDNQKAAMEEVLLAQECSKEEIAELLTPDKSLVIDEDTELDEDFDGLVIVLSGCTLTIKGVKIGVGVVILPAAEKDETEKAVAKETKVILSEKTEVTVSGSVETLTVEAPKAAVAVEAGAKVDAVVVGEKAEVGKIEDEGGNAAVTETPAEPKEDKKEPAKTPLRMSLCLTSSLCLTCSLMTVAEPIRATVLAAMAMRQLLCADNSTLPQS